MKKLYIHIGLPKCGSTFLQHVIFPEICKINNLEYFRNNEKVTKKVFKHHLNTIFKNNIERLKVSKDMIISWEKLVGYEDPFFWNKYSENNLKFFGKNSHIIIVVREPKEFLSSIYLEHCVQKHYFPRPDFYFLNKKTYSEELQQKKFSLHNFSYQKLIRLYKSKFKKVSVIKFENLFDEETYYKLFKMNFSQKKEFKIFLKKYKKNKVNKSYSSTIVKFLRYFNYFLSIFDLSLQTKVYRYDYIIKQNNQKLKTHKIRSTFKTYFSFRNLIFTFLNKIPFQKKFLIDFKKYNINLSKLNNEYKNLKTNI